MKISKPNSKTGIESFNIHNKICKELPFSKEQDCLDSCYYNKIIRIYPNQNKFLMDNYNATLKQDFVKKMNQALFELNIRFFRIHSCGEFYSVDYFKKWQKIARKNQKILFFTYTKNFNLWKYKRPINLIIYLSDNKNIWTKYYKYFDGVAKMVEKGEYKPKEYDWCPSQTKGLQCIQCQRCTKKNKKVVFIKH
jgi:hypothetical protein